MSPQWNYTVQLSDVWRNDAMTFEQRRDEIVRRLRVSRWLRTSHSVELPDVVDDLANAVTPDRFDVAWDVIYDLADEDRVWIDIWTPVPA